MKPSHILIALALLTTTAEARPRTHDANNGRPAECYGIPWCGCWLRIQKGIADKAYNLASNWRHWGQRTTKQVGAVAVLRHHVGIVTGLDANGNPIIKSGNHGHGVGEGVYSANRVIEYRM